MNDFAKLWGIEVALIGAIGDESIRKFTRDMMEGTLVWEIPASREHHLQDERERYGNLLHSVRVASLCQIISESITVTFSPSHWWPGIVPHPGSGLLNDILLSAALIHDRCRRGVYALAGSSVPDHPALVREYAKLHDISCSYSDTILTIVECHMGRWTKPVPVSLSIDAATALHLADSIVARWAEVMPSGSKENTND